MIHTLASLALSVPHSGGQLGLLGIDWLDPETLLKAGGWVALVLACAFVFFETGVIVLAFLPGDSLLFTVGMFSATGIIDVPIWITCVALFVCAFAGDQLGFTLGRKLGPAIFNRPRSRFFNPENVERTHAFFEKHGTKALVIGRFVPIVRTFITLVAGVSAMNRRTFFVWSAVGAVLWVLSITLAGYFLGAAFPAIGKNLEIAVIAIIGVSLLPMVFEWWRHRRAAASAD